MAHVPTTNLNSLYANTTSSQAADPNIFDAAMQDIVATINGNDDGQSGGLTTHKTAVTLDHPDASVTTAKIADASVTNPKYAPLSITADKIANGAVGANQLATGLSTTADTQAQFNKRGIDVTSAPYNAKGDGATDNTTAIQAAQDAVSAAGGGILYFPPGTYLCNITLDSHVYVVGSGVESTILKSVSGSNKDVIQGRNFSSLTGTAKQTPETRGVRYAGIRDIFIDGNKANNTSGFGIRIWGCSWHWENILVQNCVNDGIWTEFSDIDSPSSTDPSFQALESFYTNIKTVSNGGNGWTYNGPHDGSIINFVTFSNGGWGLYQAKGSLTGYLWNSWLNTLGSFYLGDSLAGYKIQATGGYVGTGIEIKSTTGNIELTDVYVAGHVTGIYLRGTNVRITGNVLDNHNAANTAGDAIIIDGATNYRLDVTGSSNFNVFNPISAHGANKIDANFTVGTKTFYSADIHGMADYINAYAQDTGDYIFKLPTRTMYVAGWSPVMPQSNGTIITDSTSPSSTKRGGVLQQTSPTNLAVAPTATDFNNLLTLLKQSGVLV